MTELSGDVRYFLPASQVEPYRLWFEFLKLASTDLDSTIDLVHYANWRSYGNMTFTDWWSCTTWRRLFAVATNVQVLDLGETVVADGTAVVVRLPRANSKRHMNLPLETIDTTLKFAILFWYGK